MMEYKAKASNKKVITALIIIIVSCLIVGKLTSLFTGIDAAGYCTGFGTLLLGILIISKIGINHTIRKGVLATAKIVSCEMKKIYAENITSTSDYYEVVYHIFLGDTVVQHIENTYTAVQVDEIIDVYYDYNNDWMMKKEDIDNNKSKNGYKVCLIGAIILYIIAAMFVVVSRLDTNSIVNAIKNVLMYAVGPVFSLVGILILIKPIKFKINYSNLNKISGVVKEYLMKERHLSDAGTRYIYYPVYQYWYNGEYREHISSVGNICKKNVGDIVEISIDENGYVMEKEETKSSVFLGIAFFLMGIVATIMVMSSR